MFDILDILLWLVYSLCMYIYDYKVKIWWLYYYFCRFCIMIVLIVFGVLKLEFCNL